MADTKIEWCDKVWNPITGCNPISEGCQNCYAKSMAQRLKGRCGYFETDPFQITFHFSRFKKPWREWRKPKRIFVNSMGDLFHKEVPNFMLMKVFENMAYAKQHTFMILTKRPERMKEFCSKWFKEPLPNVWLGVTVENQQRADERIPLLLQTPAVKRFVSLEPILGPVNLRQIDTDIKNVTINSLTGIPYDWDYEEWQPEDRIDSKIDWVICGGETGPGARPTELEWIGDVYEQAKDANVPFFFKSWGSNPEPKDEPKYIDVQTCREFPEMENTE